MHDSLINTHCCGQVMDVDCSFICEISGDYMCEEHKDQNSMDEG